MYHGIYVTHVYYLSIYLYNWMISLTVSYQHNYVLNP